MSRRPTILIICLALTGLFALPGAAAAKSGGGLVNGLAADACSVEKAEVGKRTFRKRYGKRPMRGCVKKTRAEARRAVAKATEECQLELEDYGEQEFYFEWESFSECVADYAAWIMDGGGFEEEEGEEEEEEGEEI